MENTSSTIPQKRPRPRPVKSCLQCRAKKRKCDREQPCSNCVLSNARDHCVYDETAGSIRRSAADDSVDRTAMSPSSTSAPLPEYRNPWNEGSPDSSKASKDTSRIAQLEDRIKYLEHALSPPSDDHHQKSRSDSGYGKSESENLKSDCGESPPIEPKFLGLGDTRSLIQLVRFPLPLNSAFILTDTKVS